MPWTFSYPADIEVDTEGVTLSFPDIPGAVTFGATRAEALDLAPDCAEAALEELLRHGDVPESARARPDQVIVPLPLRMAAKIALLRSARQYGIGPRELARRLGCDPKEAVRLLDPAHPSKVDRLAQAVRAVGGPALELRTREVA